MTKGIDTKELAQDLRLVIGRLARLIRQHAVEEDLSLTLRSALASVEREGPIAPTELAKIERVSAPSVSRIVQRLSEDRLIAKHDDPEDGRAYQMTITGAGAEMLAKTRERGSTFLETRIRSLPPSDLRRVVEAIDLLETLIASEAGTASDIYQPTA